MSSPPRSRSRSPPRTGCWPAGPGRRAGARTSGPKAAWPSMTAPGIRWWPTPRLRTPARSSATSVPRWWWRGSRSAPCASTTTAPVTGPPPTPTASASWPRSSPPPPPGGPDERVQPAEADRRLRRARQLRTGVGLPLEDRDQADPHRVCGGPRRVGAADRHDGHAPVGRACGADPQPDVAGPGAVLTKAVTGSAAGWQREPVRRCSGEVVELAVLRAVQPRRPLLGRELQRAGVRALAVAHLDLAGGVAPHLDAVVATVARG